MHNMPELLTRIELALAGTVIVSSSGKNLLHTLFFFEGKFLLRTE